MKIIHTGQGGSLASSATPSAYLRYSQMDERAVAGPQESNEPDQLDRLMSKLAAKSPRFAKKLKATGQAMAILAQGPENKETLLSLRMKAGLTQAQFAGAIGQKQANVSLMESGMRANPQRKTMHEMCKALHCSIEELDAALTASEAQYQQHACRLSPEERAIEEQGQRCA